MEEPDEAEGTESPNDNQNDAAHINDESLLCVAEMACQHNPTGTDEGEATRKQEEQGGRPADNGLGCGGSEHVRTETHEEDIQRVHGGVASRQSDGAEHEAAEDSEEGDNGDNAAITAFSEEEGVVNHGDHIVDSEAEAKPAMAEQEASQEKESTEEIAAVNHGDHVVDSEAEAKPTMAEQETSQEKESTEEIAAVVDHGGPQAIAGARRRHVEKQACYKPKWTKNHRSMDEWDTDIYALVTGWEADRQYARVTGQRRQKTVRRRKITKEDLGKADTVEFVEREDKLLLLAETRSLGFIKGRIERRKVERMRAKEVECLQGKVECLQGIIKGQVERRRVREMLAEQEPKDLEANIAVMSSGKSRGRGIGRKPVAESRAQIAATETHDREWQQQMEIHNMATQRYVAEGERLLSVASININGIKRLKPLGNSFFTKIRDLGVNQEGADLIFLQETHAKEGDDKVAAIAEEVKENLKSITGQQYEIHLARHKHESRGGTAIIHKTKIKGPTPS